MAESRSSPTPDDNNRHLLLSETSVKKRRIVWPAAAAMAASKLPKLPVKHLRLLRFRLLFIMNRRIRAANRKQNKHRFTGTMIRPSFYDYYRLFGRQVLDSSWQTIGFDSSESVIKLGPFPFSCIKGAFYLVDAMTGESVGEIKSILRTAIFQVNVRL